MDPADGFLDAILADPSDDTPRLVYADWLEEHGESEYSEFIRVQLELAQTIWPCGCGAGTRLGCRCPPSPALRRREREILEKHALPWADAALGGCAWGGVLPRGGASLVAGVEFGEAVLEWRRGFLASVSLTTADFLRHAGALFAAHPVAEVRLTDRRPAQAYGGRCWFAQGSRYPDPDVVPRELVPHLSAAVKGHNGSAFGDAAVFPAEAAAFAALSAACVAYGRAEAKKARHARRDAPPPPAARGAAP